MVTSRRQSVEEHWKGKNVDLPSLSDCIVRFFAERGFSTSLQKKDNEYLVVAAPQSFHDIAEKIRIHVLGSPDDFSVKLVAGSHSRALVRYGTFFSLVGTGFLVPKGLKSIEEIEKLEKEFRIYVDNTVWQLTNAK